MSSLLLNVLLLASRCCVPPSIFAAEENLGEQEPFLEGERSALRMLRARAGEATKLKNSVLDPALVPPAWHDIGPTADALRSFDVPNEFGTRSTNGGGLWVGGAGDFEAQVEGEEEEEEEEEEESVEEARSLGSGGWL